MVQGFLLYASYLNLIKIQGRAEEGKICFSFLYNPHGKILCMPLYINTSQFVFIFINEERQAVDDCVFV